VKLSVTPPNGDPDGDEAEETHSGRLERTAQVFRFPGTVIEGTAWRQEKNPAAFLRLRTACRGSYGKGQDESWYTGNFVRFSQKTFILHLYSGFLQSH